MIKVNVKGTSKVRTILFWVVRTLVSTDLIFQFTFSEHGSKEILIHLNNVK